MTTIDPPQDLEQRVYLERARIFYRHGRGGYLRVAATAAFIGVALHLSDVPATSIAVWAAVCALSLACLFIVGLQYPATNLTPDNARRWVVARTVVFVGITMPLCGSVFLLAPGTGVLSEVLIFGILITAISVTAVGYSTMPHIAFSLCLLTAAILSAAYLRAPDTVHFLLVALVVSAAAVVVKKAWRISEMSIEGIRSNAKL